jgi:hypothetical protein
MEEDDRIGKQVMMIVMMILIAYQRWCLMNWNVWRRMMKIN